MKLAVASGKGGTGKTTVATNLAVTLARRGQSVAYVDCDVEAPNGHLFLKPDLARETPVGRLVPRVDPARCLHCGACAEICRFNAIVCLPERTLVYDELCHSCGGCALVCPRGPSPRNSHPMGVVKTGAAGQVAVCVRHAQRGRGQQPARHPRRQASRAAGGLDHSGRAARHRLPDDRDRAGLRLRGAGDRADALWPARSAAGPGSGPDVEAALRRGRQSRPARRQCGPGVVRPGEGANPGGDSRLRWPSPRPIPKAN